MARATKSAKDIVLRVFKTTELLENILINVSTQDVFAAQLVGSAWRNAIKGSTKLKQILYLAAVPASAVTDIKGIPILADPLSSADKVEAGHCVQLFDLAVAPAIDSFSQLAELQKVLEAERRVDTNPLLEPLLCKISRGDKLLDANQAVHLPPSWQDRKASWQQMQLCKLTLVNIEIYLDYQHTFDRRGRGGDSEDEDEPAFVRNKEGVTAGELVRAIRAHIGSGMLKTRGVKVVRFSAKGVDGKSYRLDIDGSNDCSLRCES